jgi:deoxyribonucleoside regulator
MNPKQKSGIARTGNGRSRDGYSDEQLRLTARLYYVDGLGQMEVARFVKVSQAKVSRLLALARERGIVRIAVAEYEPRDEALETALQNKFGLQAAVVIKTIAGATAEEARLAVGHFGAPFVASLVKPNSTVAISGGRTMRELVQLLPEKPELGASVIQAMGSIDANVGPVDAFELGRFLARRWGGYFSTLNSPAFVPDKKTRDAFLNLEQIRSVFERLSRADFALVGIGTLYNSVFVERGVIRSEDVEKLSRRGAVGEICGRFYDEHGRECDTPWRDRVIGIELDQLRKVPQVIGIIAGGDRSAAIKAAVRGGLLKSIVMDDNCARALLAETLTPKSKFKAAK